MPVAILSGATGQDGSYLSEFLLSKGYEVHGLIRRTSTPNLGRISHILDNPMFHVHPADLLDQACLSRLINSIQPDEVYNLAAQSFVAASWDQPVATAEFTGLGVLKFLEAIRSCDKKIKFYQASSSEMFGKVQETPQKETTPFYPRSPYGVAKVYGHWITVNYRESYDMFACNGILYNHESPRRGVEFVTRKITNAVARIAHGLQKELYLGNLDSKRDWSFAADMVEAMWLMLQQDKPDDYVVASGEAHSVREFVELAFGYAELNWEEYVKVDPKFFRPAEVDVLLGDPSKAGRVLGWHPKTKFTDLVKMMVDHDLSLYN